MRWTLMRCGRTAREADGEVVWFWRLDAGVKLVRGISLATVTTKPDHREDHEGNR
jgi:hypothetical protein